MPSAYGQQLGAQNVTQPMVEPGPPGLGTAVWLNMQASHTLEHILYTVYRFSPVSRMDTDAATLCCVGACINTRAALRWHGPSVRMQPCSPNVW